eukprot:jgi/Mesvir1/14025/Mv11909-RA.1
MPDAPRGRQASFVPRAKTKAISWDEILDVDVDKFQKVGDADGDLTDALLAASKSLRAATIGSKLADEAEPANLVHLARVLQLALEYEKHEDNRTIQQLESELDAASKGAGASGRSRMNSNESATDAVIAGYEAELQELNDKITELYAALDEKDDEIDEMRDKLAEKDGKDDMRGASYLKQLLQEETAERTRVERQLRNVEASLDSERLRSDRLEEELHDERKQLSAATEQMQELEDELAELRAQLAAEQKRVDLKAQDGKGFDVKLKNKNRNIERLQRENGLLEQTIREIKAKTAQQDVEVMQLSEEIVRIEAENVEKEAQIANLKTVIEEITKERGELMETLTELQNSVADKMNLLDEFEARFRAQYTEWQIKEKDYEAQLVAAAEERTRLEEEVAKHAEHALEDRERDVSVDHDEALGQLGRNLGEKETEVVRLRRELRAAHEKEILLLEAYEQLEKDMEKEVKRALRQHEGRTGQLELENAGKDIALVSERERFEQMDEALVRAQAENEEALTRLKEYEAGVYGLSEAMRDMKKLKRAVKVGEEHLQRTLEKLTHREQQLEDVLEENYYLREKAGIPDSEALDLGDFKLAHRVELEQLRALCHQLEREVSALEEERQTLKNELRFRAKFQGRSAAEMGLSANQLELLEEFVDTLRRGKEDGTDGNLLAEAHAQLRDLQRKLAVLGSGSVLGGAAASTGSKLGGAGHGASGLSVQALTDRLMYSDVENAEVVASLAALRSEMASMEEEMEGTLMGLRGDLHNLLAAVKRNDAKGSSQERIENVLQAVDRQLALSKESRERREKLTSGNGNSAGGAASSGELRALREKVSELASELSAAEVNAVEAAVALERMRMERDMFRDRFTGGLPHAARDMRGSARGSGSVIGTPRVWASEVDGSSMKIGGGYPSPGLDISSSRLIGSQWGTMPAGNTIPQMAGTGAAGGTSAAQQEAEAARAGLDTDTFILQGQLLECLHELASREDELKAMAGEMARWQGTLQLLLDQRHMVYREYVRARGEWSREREAMRDEEARLRAQVEEARAEAEEHERGYKVLLQGDGADIKQALATATRQVASMSVKEMRALRALQVAETAEVSLRRENEELADDLSEMSIAMLRHVGYLERGKAEEEARCAALQHKLSKSVPAEEYDAMAEEARRLARENRAMVEARTQMAVAELKEQMTAGDLQRLQQEVRELTMARDEAAERARQVDAMLATVNSHERDGSVGDLREQIVSLRVKEANAQRRAETAMQEKDHAVSLRAGLMQQVSNMEAQIASLWQQLHAAEESERAATEQLAKSVPAVRLDGEVRAREEADARSTRAAADAAKWRDRARAAEERMRGQEAKHGVLREEVAALRRGVRAMEQDSDGQMALGALHEEIGRLRSREMTLVRQMERSVQEAEAAKEEAAQLRAREETLRLQFQQAQSDAQRAASEMRAQVGRLRGALELRVEPRKGEEWFASLKDATERLSELNARVAAITNERHELLNRCEAAEAKLALAVDVAQILKNAESGAPAIAEAVRQNIALRDRCVQLQLAASRADRQSGAMCDRVRVLEDLDAAREAKVEAFEEGLLREKSTLEQNLADVTRERDNLRKELDAARKAGWRSGTDVGASQDGTGAGGVGRYGSPLRAFSGSGSGMEGGSTPQRRMFSRILEAQTEAARREEEQRRLRRLDRLERKLAVVRDRGAEDAAAQHEWLQAQVDQLAGEIEEQRGALREQVRENVRLKDTADVLADELRAAKVEAMSAEKDLLRVQQERDALIAQLKDRVVHATQAMVSDGSREGSSDADIAAHVAEVAQGTIDRLQVTVREKNEALGKYRETVAQMRAAHTAELGRQQEEILRLQEAITRLEAERLRDIRMALGDVEARVAEFGSGRYAHMGLEQLQDALEEREREMQLLNERLTATQAQLQSHIDDVEARAAAAAAEHRLREERLQRELEAERALQPERSMKTLVGRLQAQVATRDKKLGALKDAIRELEKKLVEAMKAAADASLKESASQRSLAAEDRLEKATAALEAAREEAERAKRELSQLKEEVAAKDAAAKADRTKAEEAGEALRKLQLELAKERRLVRGLRNSEAKEREARIASESPAGGLLADKMAELEKRAAIYAAQVDKLKAKLRERDELGASLRGSRAVDGTPSTTADASGAEFRTPTRGKSPVGPPSQQKPPTNGKASEDETEDETGGKDSAAGGPAGVGKARRPASAGAGPAGAAGSLLAANPALKRWEDDKKLAKKVEALKAKLTAAQDSARVSEERRVRAEERAAEQEKRLRLMADKLAALTKGGGGIGGSKGVDAGKVGRQGDAAVSGKGAAASERVVPAAVTESERVREMADIIAALEEENGSIRRQLDVGLGSERLKWESERDELQHAVARWRAAEERARRRHAGGSNGMNGTASGNANGYANGGVSAASLMEQLQEAEARAADQQKDSEALREALLQRDIKVLELRFEREYMAGAASRLQRQLKALFDEEASVKLSPNGALHGSKSQRPGGRPPTVALTGSAARIEELEMVVQALQRVVEKLRGENEGLRKHSNQAGKLADTLTRCKELKRRVLELEEELAAVRRRDAATAGDVRLGAVRAEEEVKELRRQLAAERDAHGALRRELESETDPTIRKWVTGILRDKPKVAGHGPAATAITEGASSKDVAAPGASGVPDPAMVAALERLRIENGRLRDELEARDKLVAELRAQVASGKAALGEAEGRAQQLAALQTEVQRLRQAAAARADAGRATGKVAEADVLASEPYRQLDREYQALSARAATLQAENEELQNEFSAFDAEFFEEIEDLKYEHNVLKKACAMYQDMLVEYAQQLGVPFQPLELRPRR